nr:MAG TPA: hypothetical protein [Caudoviricetes sp.]DAT97788.1 MAG TPA: hypothetical protein [Caudoviricetes sp.]
MPDSFQRQQPRQRLAQKQSVAVAAQYVVDFANHGVWVIHALSSFRYFHYIQQLVVKQSAK